MTINYASMTIEMTKAESKAAGKIGTEEFKNMLSLMQQFPNYKIQVATRAATKKSCDYKGLTFAYMENYIKTHDNKDKSIMAEYQALRGKSKEAEEYNAKSVSYGEMKEWFLAKFPEIKEFHQNRQKLLCAAN